MTLLVQCTTCQRTLPSAEFIARTWRQLTTPADHAWACCSFCRGTTFTIAALPIAVRIN
jgi:hypothetical protein